MCVDAAGKLDASRPGFVVETLRAVAEARKLGLEIRLMPWSRALLAVEKNEVEGLALAQGSLASRMILTSTSMGETRACLYKRKGDPWAWTGLASLGSMRLGAVQDLAIPELAAYISRHGKDPARVQLTTGENPFERNFAKLILKRTDLVVADQAVSDAILAANHWKDKVVQDHCFPATPFFLGFSFRSPRAKDLAKAFSDGLRELRASGALKRMLGHYGVALWAGD